MFAEQTLKCPKAKCSAEMVANYNFETVVLVEI